MEAMDLRPKSRARRPRPKPSHPPRPPLNQSPLRSSPVTITHREPSNTYVSTPLPSPFCSLSSQPCIAVPRLAVAALLLLASPMAQAQFAAPSPGTHVMDTSALHPPPGARVAIVEFVDMECPICGSTNPIIRAAAATYHIPIVRHD